MSNLRNRLCWCLPLLIAFPLSCGASSQGALLDDVTGYYSSPSHLCTERKGGDLAACKKKLVDCLVIRKKSQTSAEFELFTTQANQHVCAARGKLIQNGNILEAPRGTKDAAPNEGLSIRVERDSLIVDYKKSEASLVGICGSHAALNGLTFKRQKRRTSGPTCFND